MFSGLARSQHAIELILVSDEADSRVDSNDSSPMCLSSKTKQLFKFLLEKYNYKNVETTILNCLSNYDEPGSLNPFPRWGTFIIAISI